MRRPPAAAKAPSTGSVVVNSSSSLYQSVVKSVSLRAREEMKAMSLGGQLSKMPTISVEELHHHVASRTTATKSAMSEARSKLKSCSEFVAARSVRREREEDGK